MNDREAFEDGIKSINFPLKRKGEGYRSPYTDAMWLAYQRGIQRGIDNLPLMPDVNQKNCMFATKQ